MRKIITILFLAVFMLSPGFSGCIAVKDMPDKPVEELSETEDTLVAENTAGDTGKEDLPGQNEADEQAKETDIDEETTEGQAAGGDENSAGNTSKTETDNQTPERTNTSAPATQTSTNTNNANNNSTSTNTNTNINTKTNTNSNTGSVANANNNTSNTTGNQNISLQSMRTKMLELINAERKKAGLKPLTLDSELTKVANLKAEDMVKNNYFSHISPTYGDPSAMMEKFGLEYKTAGENLASASTVEKAHRSLMNSSGHRANILNPDFIRVGIGIYKSPKYGYAFVQLFAGITVDEYKRKLEEEIKKEMEKALQKAKEETKDTKPADDQKSKDNNETEVKEAEPKEIKFKVEPITPQTRSSMQQYLLKKINAARKKKGLHELKWVSGIANVAGIKAKELSEITSFANIPKFSVSEVLMKHSLIYPLASGYAVGTPDIEVACIKVIEGCKQYALSPDYYNIGIGIENNFEYGYVFVFFFAGKAQE